VSSAVQKKLYLGALGALTKDFFTEKINIYKELCNFFFKDKICQMMSEHYDEAVIDPPFQTRNIHQKYRSEANKLNLSNAFVDLETKLYSLLQGDDKNKFDKTQFDKQLEKLREDDDGRVHLTIDKAVPTSGYQEELVYTFGIEKAVKLCMGIYGQLPENNFCRALLYCILKENYILSYEVYCRWFDCYYLNDH
jgi:hypothetical protein